MSGYFDRLLARAAGEAADALPALPARSLPFVPEAEPEPGLAPTPSGIVHANPMKPDREDSTVTPFDPAVPTPAAPNAPGRAAAEAPPFLQDRRSAPIPPVGPSALTPPPGGVAKPERPIAPTPPEIRPLRPARASTLAAPRRPLPLHRSAPSPPPAPAPDVQITIGRVDIVVPSPTAPPPRETMEAEWRRDEAALPSLADYLKARATR